MNLDRERRSLRRRSTRSPTKTKHSPTSNPPRLRPTVRRSPANLAPRITAVSGGRALAVGNHARPRLETKQELLAAAPDCEGQSSSPRAPPLQLGCRASKGARPPPTPSPARQRAPPTHPRHQSLRR